MASFPRTRAAGRHDLSGVQVHSESKLAQPSPVTDQCPRHAPPPRAATGVKSPLTLRRGTARGVGSGRRLRCTLTGLAMADQALKTLSTGHVGSNANAVQFRTDQREAPLQETTSRGASRRPKECLVWTAPGRKKHTPTEGRVKERQPDRTYRAKGPPRGGRALVHF